MKGALSLAPAVALAVLTGGTHVGASEANYSGKPAAFWLAVWHTNNDSAGAAFAAMGTNAIPFLIEILETEPSSLSRFADRQSAKYRTSHPNVADAITKYLPSAFQIEERREAAASFLSSLGTNAAAAIPAIFQAYTSTNVSWRLESELEGALHGMGEKCVILLPDYLNWLTNSDSRVQELAARLIGSIGPKARAAVPALMKATRSTNRSVMFSAANALWAIDRQTNLVLRIYGEKLKSSQSADQQSALYFFRYMGPAALNVVQQIEPLLESDDDSVRKAAEKTLREVDSAALESSLRKINAKADRMIATLIALMRESDFPVRMRALETIGVFGTRAKVAVPELVAALDGYIPPLPMFTSISRQNCQYQAADALGEIGPAAIAAVPRLLSLVNASDPYSANYCRALGKIGPEARAAIPSLESLLNSENYLIRATAADALTRISPSQCSNAINVLKSLQKESEPPSPWLSVGHKPQGMTVPLVAHETSMGRRIRLNSTVSLWRLGFEKEPPVAALSQGLEDSRDVENIWRADLLGELGPAAKEVLPKLRNLLDPDNWIRVRRASAIAIRKIDPVEADRLNLPGILGIP